MSIQSQHKIPVFRDPYKPHNAKNASPSELFHAVHRKKHSHTTTPHTTDHRAIRLLRKSYPANLFRDSPNQQIALAMPLAPRHYNCPTAHKTWHQISAYVSPVECAICLCAGDCRGDGDAFWSCSSCCLRICDSCRTIHVHEGTKALTERYNDGEHTAEAKRALKENESVSFG